MLLHDKARDRSSRLQPLALVPYLIALIMRPLKGLTIQQLTGLEVRYR